MIENANLFKSPPRKYPDILPSCKEYFEHIERERSKDFEVLARKYRAIGPLLTKMEGLVVHTNSGRSPKLHQYYSHWEKKAYEALTQVCISLSLNIKILDSTKLKPFADGNLNKVQKIISVFDKVENIVKKRVSCMSKDHSTA